MYITAFFTKNAIPETGLTPTIRIRKASDNSLVVTDAAMTEIGDGIYKYWFATYDGETEYVMRCDGGATLPDSERYTYGVNDNYTDDIDERLSANHGYGIWETADLTGVVRANIVAVDGNAVTSVDDFKADLTNLEIDIRRILGLVQENYYLDQTAYDEFCNLTTARLRTYTNPASVGTNADVLATYQIDAVYDSEGNMETYQVVKV